jgi:hypothetical protein
MYLHPDCAADVLASCRIGIDGFHCFGNHAIGNVLDYSHAPRASLDLRQNAEAQ